MDMQTLTQSEKIVLTKQQLEDIVKFKTDLKNGAVEFDFEGSALEGKAYLHGLAEIVETVNH